MGDYALYLDDMRYPPGTGEDWVLCRTVASMRDLLEQRGIPSLASFDYDLGRTDPGHSGEDAVISFLDYILSTPPGEAVELEVRLHSSSSYGVARMAALLRQSRVACEQVGVLMKHQ